MRHQNRVKTLITALIISITSLILDKMDQKRVWGATELSNWIDPIDRKYSKSNGAYAVDLQNLNQPLDFVLEEDIRSLFAGQTAVSFHFEDFFRRKIKIWGRKQIKKAKSGTENIIAMKSIKFLRIDLISKHSEYF
jgi:hypothetical protein